MKKLMLITILGFGALTATLAQSNTAVNAEQAVPVVNAADHSNAGAPKACSPDQKNEAKASSGGCCASKGQASADNKKSGSCESAAFSTSAQAPKKDE